MATATRERRVAILFAAPRKPRSRGRRAFSARLRWTATPSPQPANASTRTMPSSARAPRRGPSRQRSGSIGRALRAVDVNEERRRCATPTAARTRRFLCVKVLVRCEREVPDAFWRGELRRTFRVCLPRSASRCATVWRTRSLHARSRSMVFPLSRRSDHGTTHARRARECLSVTSFASRIFRGRSVSSGLIR